MLIAHEFGWTLGVGDGQGGLASCDSWGRKESDTTEQLNWTELNWQLNWQLNNILSSTVAYQLMMLLHIGFTEKEQVTID